MLNRSETSNDPRLALSSLMDGELKPGDVGGACNAWHRDADTRACWHSYHLIGDVLRSDDLAGGALHNEAFLQRLRLRLADEPVPMAPSILRDVPAAAVELPQPRLANGVVSRRFASRLVAPMAMAAGFVVVAAGVILVPRLVAPVVPVQGNMASVAASSKVASTLAAPGGELVRDARLDRYLAAHRMLANNMMAPGGAEHRVQIVLESK